MLLGRIVRVLPKQSPLLRGALLTWRSQQQNQQVRWAGAGFTRSHRRPSKSDIVVSEGKSEWWVVDGEMHEIGDHIPHRERFVIPRDNLPNRRRKQMREQFMRRTRLVLKESEHEQWCKRYMELYNELRENSERLYWDEGYSKQVAEDHANYESSEDDDLDFSPYRRRQPYAELNKDQSFGGPRCSDSGEKVRQIRDMFEYDRERKMREKAFAPMNASDSFSPHHSAPRNQLLVARESNASDSANPHKSTPRYEPFDSRRPIASDSFNPHHSAARNQPLSASKISAFAPMNASDSFSAHHSIGWESNASDSFNPHKSAPRNPPFDARKSSASDNFDPHHPAPRNQPLNASKNSS